MWIMRLLHARHLTIAVEEDLMSEGSQEKKERREPTKEDPQRVRRRLPEI
jgi:hypothetical protein